MLQLKETVCVCTCVWSVIVTVQDKETILITIWRKTAVAWAIQCPRQLFISLACMDTSKMILSQHVYSGIPSEHW